MPKTKKNTGARTKKAPPSLRSALRAFAAKCFALEAELGRLIPAARKPRKAVGA